MLPLTLFAPQKLADLLTNGSALQDAVQALSAPNGVVLPSILPNQIAVTSITPEMADKNAQMTYPRVCLYTAQIKNTLEQKFCSFSGVVTLVADVWFSASLIAATGIGLHYYVEAIASILQANQGDWGDGFTFSGAYSVQLRPTHIGGFGFVESAALSCSLDVNQP